MPKKCILIKCQKFARVCKPLCSKSNFGKWIDDYIPSLKSAYTYNEIDSKKNHEIYTRFSSVVGGQHLLELTTFSSAPK